MPDLGPLVLSSHRSCLSGLCTAARVRDPCSQPTRSSTLSGASVANPTTVPSVAIVVDLAANDQIMIGGTAGARGALAATVAVATHAVVAMDAAVAAPSFVAQFPAVVAAVVVASPPHILVQRMLPPLERQQMTMRPGFEPQACRVPTQRGIYLFSVIVDIIQVRRICTASSIRPHRHVCCRSCPCPCACSCCLLVLNAHSSCDRYVLSTCLCACICSRSQGQQGRSKKAMFEYVILAGSFLLPTTLSFACPLGEFGPWASPRERERLCVRARKSAKSSV